MKKSLIGMLVIALALGMAVVSCDSGGCTHDWSSWSVTTAATCVAQGIETRTCSVCSETEQRSIIATGQHSYGLWAITTDATQEIPVGQETRTCQSDGCTESETRTGGSFFYTIGDTGPGNGKIFYVADGQEDRPLGFYVEGYGSPGDTHYFAGYTAHYLEVAPHEDNDWLWGAAGTLIPGVTTYHVNMDRDFGRGRKDTVTIVAYLSGIMGPTVAAEKAYYQTHGDKNDWFLPSLGELRKLLLNEGEEFELYSVGYWSSTQMNDVAAWSLGMGSNNNKNTRQFVRAVRAF